MVPLTLRMTRSLGGLLSLSERNERRRLAIIARVRVQLLVGFLVAVWLPAMLRWGWDWMEAARWASLYNSLFGSLAALVLGYFILRQLIAFPGVEASVYIFPAFAVSYGALITVLMLLRLDYSRYQILSSFALAVIWFYWVFFVARRNLQPRLALVPGGRDFGIAQIDLVEVVPLKEPRFKGLAADAIVADLHSDLTADWEAFIAKAALKGIPVYHAKQISESLTGKVEVEHLSENTFGSVLPSLIYRRVKRLTDLIGVMLYAVPILIAIGAAAIAIKLDTKGPVFFLQRRMGYRGRVFTMVKLRTMHESSEQLHFTREDDDRI